MSKSDALQDRIHPRGEWVLCRQVERKSNILRVNGDSLAAQMHAEVVSHGPGEFMNGTFVDVKGLPRGTIVLVPGPHCVQFPDWKDDRLFACPASSIIATLDASVAEMFETGLVVPKRVLS